MKTTVYRLHNKTNEEVYETAFWRSALYLLKEALKRGETVEIEKVTVEE